MQRHSDLQSLKKALLAIEIIQDKYNDAQLRYEEIASFFQPS